MSSSVTNTTSVVYDTVTIGLPRIEEAKLVDIATFNASLNRNAAGQLVTDLSTPDNAQAKVIAEIIQIAAPDILLINEFDFAPQALDLFQDNYLSVAQDGAAPIDYAYSFIAPSNTGVASGFDLNNNGAVVTTPGAPGYGDDALGFGAFEGQFGMAFYSKYEILTDQIRTFQTFLWKDMPGALLPDDPNTAAPNDWYSPEELAIFRLSSKSHWDIPVLIDGQVVHILAAHPTPPVFDGPEDRNGKRNHDEIRFWSDYVTPGKGGYIYDDEGNVGGLAPGSRFVIMGDYNADPQDGDSVAFAINQLLDNPVIDDSVKPDSPGGPDAAVRNGGANATHQGDPAFDTADFADSLPFNPGNLRVDYVLGGKAGLVPIDGSVFWPAQGTTNFDLVGNFPFPSSDHRLVEMTFAVVEETAVELRLWQDALFDGRGTASPTGQLRKPATDLTYTDATGAGVQHSAADDDSTGTALARFLEAYGDVAVSAVDFAGGGQVAGNNAITLDWGISGALLVRLDLAWNAIKAIAIDEYTGPSLRVENFVDVLVTLSGSQGQAVAVDGAKRGVITTGDGNDTVLVGVDSNERNWSNSFRIETGDGNDSITIATASRNYVGGFYDGRHTTTTIDAGAGSDSITGGAGADTIVLRQGEADGDSITNFSGAGGQGDTVQLVGFGTGASFSFAAGQLVITSAAGTETVTLAGVAALAANDVIFV